MSRDTPVDSLTPETHGTLTGAGFLPTQEIGRGAAGVVYRAKSKDLGLVAVKVMRSSGLLREARRSRFVREAEIVKGLDHPHIVRVHRLLELPSGGLALVMDLVEGRSLRTLLSQGPLPRETTLSILDQLASALEYAHGRGIIHRDVKPENVLVGQDGRAFLTDFGVAKALHAPSEGLTQDGSILGTTRYMAPESVLGGEPSVHSDVYSLGVVAWECLTGHHPFGEYSMARLLEAIVHDGVPDFPEDVRAAIPESLASVVLRATALDPDDRWEDMSSFRRALRIGVSDSAPFGVSGQSAKTLRWRKQRRNRTRTAGIAIAGGVGLITLLAGLTLIVLPTEDRPSERGHPASADGSPAVSPGDPSLPSSMLFALAADGELSVQDEQDLDRFIEAFVSEYGIPLAEGMAGEMRRALALLETRPAGGGTVPLRWRREGGVEVPQLGTPTVFATLFRGPPPPLDPQGAFLPIWVREVRRVFRVDLDAHPNGPLVKTLSSLMVGDYESALQVLEEHPTDLGASSRDSSVDQWWNRFFRTIALLKLGDLERAEQALQTLDYIVSRAEYSWIYWLGDLIVAERELGNVHRSEPAEVGAELGSDRAGGDAETAGSGVDAVSEMPDLHLAPGVSVRDSRVCATTVDGLVYCWGRFGIENPEYQRMELSDFAIPRKAGGVRRFASVGVAEFSSCGLTAEGRTYCWGWPPMSDRIPEDEPELQGDAPPFSELAFGYGHICGLTPNGEVYCWGDVRDGRLGNGELTDTYASRKYPELVVGGHRFTEISGGDFHTCGVTSESEAYCWGVGRDGRLGNGDLENKATPQRVAGSLSFKSVDAGAYHTCGVALDGAAYCWGRGDLGRLGTGDTAIHSTPQAVATTLRFTIISAGATHTCGIATDGLAYCWGGGNRGQLGNGRKLDLSTTPQAVVGSHRFEDVSAGGFLSCGTTTESEVYCWGWGQHGGLGNGDTADHSAPQPVLSLAPDDPDT